MIKNEASIIMDNVLDVLAVSNTAEYGSKASSLKVCQPGEEWGGEDVEIERVLRLKSSRSAVQRPLNGIQGLDSTILHSRDKITRSSQVLGWNEQRKRRRRDNI
jgi:hypothetical protein